MLIAVLSVLLAACAGTPSPAGNGTATLPIAPTWQGAAAVDAVGTAGWAVVPYPRSITDGPDANRRPDFVVYRVTTGSGQVTTTQVTPPGVVVRGGVAVSALSGEDAWVGIGSYRYQLDGAVARTTDGGVHWSEYALPAPFQPAPDGIAAQSPTSAVVLAGTGHRRFLLQSTDGGDSWVNVATSATLLGAEQGTCTLDGVASGSGGSVLVGSACSGGTGRLVRWKAPDEVTVATVAPPAPAGNRTTVTVIPSSSTGGSSILASATWTDLAGGTSMAGVVGTVDLAPDGTRSAGIGLGVVGNPLVVTPRWQAVSVVGAGDGSQAQAVLTEADPTAWRHPGSFLLDWRAGPSDPWIVGAAPAVFSGHPAAVGWLDLAGSGTGGAALRLLVAGSATSELPAMWLDTTPTTGTGGSLTWLGLHLSVPTIPTSGVVGAGN